MKKFEKLDRLFAEGNALRDDETADQLFLEAVQEVFSHHYESSEVYRNICDNGGFSPESLQSIENISDIPWLMVNVFKWYHLTSVPDEDIVKTFSSSGTTGQKSHIAWDQGSFDRQTAMRSNIIRSYGLTVSDDVNYLCFTYAPELAGGRGAPYAHNQYTTFAPAKEKFFAIYPDWEGKEHFSAEECVQKLAEFAKSGLPLRIVGFPAFAWRALQYMVKNDIKLNFPADSLIIFAGGWKAMADESIPQDVFAEYVQQHLGVPKSRIRDIYGFVEHGVPYVTCEAGHFHLPIYSRAYARKPGTLEVLAEGERGLLHVVSPYNIAQPNISVLSTDYVSINSGCSCGRKSSYISLMGRAGVQKHQGCAISATELLQK
jgi:phenylacetate-coenzyme A ligase PaaK-like adenylate-forming protein